MNLKECYAALDGNYDEVLGRLRSERLVQKFVLKFLDDGSYALLCQALEAGDLEEAVRAAHTIKGICQDLGFQHLLESSTRLTDALRSDLGANIPELAVRMGQDYHQTVAAIQAFQAANAG